MVMDRHHRDQSGSKMASFFTAASSGKLLGIDWIFGHWRRFRQNRMSRKSISGGEPKKNYRNTMSKQEAALKQFKESLGDLIPADESDLDLMKWLKARCYDVRKAEHMYRDSMAYREKMKADTILEDYTPPEVIQKYLTGGFCGFDKEGSPVRVERFGFLDMKGLMYSCKKVDMEKTKLVQCESTLRVFKEQTKKLGTRVDGITVIFDMENVGAKSLWRPGLQMYLHLVKVLEDNYPEMMKTMFVVNAPRIFPLLWKICRPLISEDMKNKIHVLGGDYKNVLMKYIDAEELPAFLGGKLRDSDGNPMCAEKICLGGEVPQSFYLSELINVENMESATIPKGDVLTLEVEVENQGSLLRWEFKTEDYDISFGVKYKGADETVDIIPTERVNCHMVPEDGSITCDKAGTYTVCFDNSYSWARAKKLHYLVELHTNDNKTEAEVNQISGDGFLTRLCRNMVITHM